VERAPLRPLPSRPPGAADPDDAVRHVTAVLSTLDAPAAVALALIALAGRSRAEAARHAGMSADELGAAVARGRKALRRSVFALSGSGWCERAERMISDRLDGALEAPGPARLDAHLRNCQRCVEHERRLAQATDLLVAGFVERHPAGQPPPAPPPKPPPELMVLDSDTAKASKEAESGPAARLGQTARTVLLVLAVLLAVAVALIAVLSATGVSL
jgi:Putative zinc-finger